VIRAAHQQKNILPEKVNVELDDGEDVLHEVAEDYEIDLQLHDVQRIRQLTTD